MAQTSTHTPTAPPPPDSLLLDVPDAPLRTILHAAGPHTRLSCRRFHQTYGPPTHLTPRPTPTLRTRSEIATALLSLPSLPDIHTLDLTHLPVPDKTELTINTPDGTQPLALAATCTRLTAINHSSNHWSPQHLAALVALHSPSLQHLHGVVLGDDKPAPTAQSPTEDSALNEQLEGMPATQSLRSLLPPPSHPSLLLGCTSLQRLHVLYVERPVPAFTTVLTTLTALRQLSFKPLPFDDDEDGGPAGFQYAALDLLGAAAQLPQLEVLELPNYDIVWDSPAAELLGTMTQLTALQLGTAGVAGTRDSCGAAMVSAVARLPLLRRLVVTDPGWWVPVASHSVLQALTGLRSLGLEVLTVDMDWGPDVQWSDPWTLTIAAGLLDGHVQAPLTELRLSCSGGIFSEPLILTSTALAPLVVQHGQTLQALVLDGTWLTLDCFQILAGLRLLHHLELRNLHLWSAVSNSIAQTHPDFTEFFLSLPRLTALTSLTVDFRSDAVADELAMNATAIPQAMHLTRLQELHLPQWTPETPLVDVPKLLPLRQLQVLSFAGPLGGGKGQQVCAVLRQLTSLQRVHAVHAGFTIPRTWLLAGQAMWADMMDADRQPCFLTADDLRQLAGQANCS